MEGKSEESGTVDEAAPPSVAKLAGLFGDKIVAPRKEAPPLKPTRKKPPCSLPLPKPEATNNGEEKVSPHHGQAPKIKVKSSPLIEKLQANLAFAPAAFLPGASPKSPGLKVMASPFNSPPSTPSSPGLHPRSSESEESPVSFEQPAEGAPLPSYTKVRTRGSLKRRPPSRRFRKSQTEMDFDVDMVMPKANGDKGTEEDAGSVKGSKEEGPAHTDSAPESPPGDPSNTQEEGDTEKQEADTSPEAAEQQGDNSNKEEGTLDTGLTDIAAAAEPALVTGSTEETGSSQEQSGSTEHRELEAEDKPEK